MVLLTLFLFTEYYTFLYVYTMRARKARKHVCYRWIRSSFWRTGSGKSWSNVSLTLCTKASSSTPKPKWANLHLALLNNHVSVLCVLEHHIVSLSAQWADAKAEGNGCHHGWVLSLIWIYSGLREHLRTEDLAGGSVSYHQLQRRAGV